MEVYTALNRGGKAWTPQFVQELNQEDCLGCGRCYKACGHSVLGLVGISEEGEIVDAFDDEAERKVMSIMAEESCIGCQACGRACPKDLYTYTTIAIPA